MEFGTRLLSKSRELYISADGSLTANRELEIITNDLTKICEGLVDPDSTIKLKKPSGAEVALTTLSKSCKDLGDEFLGLLQDLKVRGRHKKWTTLYQAVRTVYKEKKIGLYEERLNNHRSQISTHLLSLLRYFTSFSKELTRLNFPIANIKVDSRALVRRWMS